MRIYKCADCSQTLTRSGTGLGTWTCDAHPIRWATVTKDLTGGHETALKAGEQAVPCMVKRHTKVRVS